MKLHPAHNKSYQSIFIEKRERETFHPAHNKSYQSIFIEKRERESKETSPCAQVLPEHIHREKYTLGTTSPTRAYS